MITISGESDLLLTCVQETDGIAVLRCQSSAQTIYLPDCINHLPIVRLGDYAFSSRSPKSLPPDSFFVRITTGSDELITHNAAEIRRVRLPQPLIQLGSYCFYNCTKLEHLEIGSELSQVGADAFMNCFSLHQLLVHTSAQNCRCLRTILQIYSGELEVTFLSDNSPECHLFFPAFDEEYEEMAAPHIFYYNIAGNGYLCRQSFTGHTFQFAQYDAAFHLLLQTHSFQLATLVALDRLQYPVELGDGAKADYLRHLTSHDKSALEVILSAKDTVRLSFFLNLGIVSAESLAAACTVARNAGQTEALGLLLDYQNRNFGAPKAKTFDL